MILWMVAKSCPTLRDVYLPHITVAGSHRWPPRKSGSPGGSARTRRNAHQSSWVHPSGSSPTPLLQCEAPKIAEHNSNFTMVYGTQITIVTGANLNQRSHHWGGAHCAFWAVVWPKQRVNHLKHSPGIQSVPKKGSEKVAVFFPTADSCHLQHRFFSETSWFSDLMPKKLEYVPQVSASPIFLATHFPGRS